MNVEKSKIGRFCISCYPKQRPISYLFDRSKSDKTNEVNIHNNGNKVNCRCHETGWKLVLIFQSISKKGKTPFFFFAIIKIQ